MNKDILKQNCFKDYEECQPEWNVKNDKFEGIHIQIIINFCVPKCIEGILLLE